MTPPPCPRCGSGDVRDYATTPEPPRGKKAVPVPGWICWACRLWRPRQVQP